MTVALEVTMKRDGIAWRHDLGAEEEMLGADAEWVDFPRDRFPSA